MRFTIRDDLRRSRLTTGFRIVLAVPHLVWLYAWGSVLLIVLPFHWIATLVRRRPVEELHDFYELYVRYTLHVYAYLFGAADPYPGFLGKLGTYPVDVARIPCETQSRRSVGFRFFLALPPFLLAASLGGGFVTAAGSTLSVSTGAAMTAAVLGWFAVLATGRMPPGLRDAAVYGLTYATRVAAYFFLVTARFPDSRLDAVPLSPRPPHPVRMTNEDDRARHRLLVFFRLLLLVPHGIWFSLWGVVAFLAAFVAWLAALATGRVPGALHRFLAAYVRYGAHVVAFGSLAGGKFPGFTGAPGVYPIDVAVPLAPERQSRWTVGFRGLLAVPAFFMGGALGAAQFAASVGAWFYALVRGRMPPGLHQLLAYVVRYTTQVYAYVLLVTPVYPHSGPSEDEHEPEAVLLEAFLLTPERPQWAR